MPLLWEAPEFVKIHEGCGGRVRWVEAIDTQGVGFTGDCLTCTQDRIVAEQIIPVLARGEQPGFGGEFDIRDTVLDRPRDKLAALEWDDDQDFDANQARLRREITGATADQQGGRA